MTDTTHYTLSSTELLARLLATARLDIQQEYPDAALRTVATAEIALTKALHLASVQWNVDECRKLLDQKGELLMIRGQAYLANGMLTEALQAHIEAGNHLSASDDKILQARNILHTLRTHAGLRSGMRTRYALYARFNVAPYKKGVLRALLLTCLGYYGFWAERQLMEPLM